MHCSGRNNGWTIQDNPVLIEIKPESQVACYMCTIYIVISENDND